VAVSALTAGFEAMLARAAAWRDRVWAAEGCEGIGKHLVLRLLADRRRRIGEDHTRIVCQLHQILLELLPGGARKALSAAQARKLLTTVRPQDAAGKVRKRAALELAAGPERLCARKKAANKELAELVKAAGTALTDLHGIGPSCAPRLLAEVGDITRFPSKG
jgi:transposase